MRLILADDQELFREGVKKVLSQCDWVDVVGEAADEAGLSGLLDWVNTDAVMLDPAISDSADMGVIERLQRVNPDVIIVVLGNPDRVDEHVGRAIELGCQGYLLKNLHSEELVAALNAVAEGHHYIQEQLIPRLFDARRRDDRLSPTHLTTLQHLADGLSNREIASLIGVSETTLKSHLRLIYAQLNASTRVEAVATAFRRHLVE
jgi:DNA-binding NarL/FixJ family response regulator